MYPLLALRALTANVKHVVGKLAEVEDGLGDTSGAEARA